LDHLRWVMKSTQGEHNYIRMYPSSIQHKNFDLRTCLWPFHLKWIGSSELEVFETNYGVNLLESNKQPPSCTLFWGLYVGRMRGRFTSLSLSHLTSKEEEKEKKNAAITKHTRLVDYEVLEYKSFVRKHMVFSWASSPGTLAKAPALMFPSLRATYKHMIALIREICATIELDLRT
jgi:hypothetical protein